MIDPLKYYTITELLELSKEGYFPVKSRTSVIRIIKAGKLRAINVGAEDRPNYTIKGEDILVFLDSRGRFTIQKRHDN